MGNSATRRDFLRWTTYGAASASLLPLIRRQALAQSSGIKRLIIWYTPEGCSPQAFWPAVGPGPLNINMDARVNNSVRLDARNGSIANYRSQATGTYCLQPLKRHESSISIVSGFTNTHTPGEFAHPPAVASALTGNRPREGSFDQIMAPHLRGDAPIESILSTCFGEHTGRSGGHLSPFRSREGREGNPTWNPVTTYNQLFPDGVGMVSSGPNHRVRSRLAVMGGVRSALNDLRCRGGQVAQERAEAYLASIEGIEAETERLIQNRGPSAPVNLPLSIPAGWENTGASNRYWRDPANFGTLVKIQIDTTVAALALDRTRVSLMQFSASGNSGNGGKDHYRRVGISDLESAGSTQDHEMTHGDANQGPERRNQARIFRWYYAQMAYLIDQLQSIPDENGGTLFDSTLIITGTEWSARNHREDDMPYLIAGNPSGAFRMGQYLDARRGNSMRRHADFYLTVAQGLGVNLTHFGESDGVYGDLLA